MCGDTVVEHPSRVFFGQAIERALHMLEKQATQGHVGAPALKPSATGGMRSDAMGAAATQARPLSLTLSDRWGSL